MRFSNGILPQVSSPGSPRARNRSPPPDLLPGHRIEGDDHAGMWPAPGQTASSGDGLAVGDDRASPLDRRVLAVVEDLGFPDHLPGCRIEREQVVVDAGVDNEVAVDRDVAVVAAEQPADGLGRQFGDRALVFPDQIARRRVERLNHVVGIGHVHHAVVHQRRRGLTAAAQGTRPDLNEVGDVLRCDGIERAVAPGIGGATPGEPILRRRIG